jgi:hypothetical protein
MPLCEGCGSSYEDQFQFCPFCGRAKPNRPETGLANEVTVRDDSDLACPRCHKSDRVEKITSIIAHQTNHADGYVPVAHTITDGDGHIASVMTHERTSSTSSSILSSQLAYPFHEPDLTKKGNPVSEIAWGVGLCLAGLLGFFTYNDRPVCLGLSITGFVIAALLFWHAFTVIDRISKLERQIKEERPLFQKYRARWEKSFYCYRDGSVFVPGEKSYASSEDLVEFVKKV